MFTECDMKRAQAYAAKHQATAVILCLSSTAVQQIVRATKKVVLICCDDIDKLKVKKLTHLLVKMLRPMWRSFASAFACVRANVCVFGSVWWGMGYQRH